MRPIDRAELMAHLEDWSSARPEHEGIKFARSTDRVKNAAWVTADSEGRLAQLIVWSSGETELTLGFENDPRVNEHHGLEELSELDALLDRVAAWLDAGTS